MKRHEVIEAVRFSAGGEKRVQDAALLPLKDNVLAWAYGRVAVGRYFGWACVVLHR